MWKEIPRFNGMYLISDEGEVFSTRTKKLMSVQTRKDGYRYIDICIDGKDKNYFIHRLVAETFIPNPDNLPAVNHKDENPSNNNVDNLEWCTHKYNINYGTCIERRANHTDYKLGSENAKSKTVYQFDLEGNFIKEYGSTYEAGRETGLVAHSIAKCCCGKLKQYRGYYWSYENKFGYDNVYRSNFKNGKILMYDTEGNLIKRFENPQELKADGFDQIQVNRVCRGERKSYKGFVFKHESKE